jgi:hypothetical protein
LNLGRADGRYFAVNCGAGVDAAAMRRLDAKFPKTTEGDCDEGFGTKLDANNKLVKVPLYPSYDRFPNCFQAICHFADDLYVLPLRSGKAQPLCRF